MKKLLIALAAMAAMTMPARADEAELLARIEALEQRVAQLEALIAENDNITNVGQTTFDESIELATGTWITGENIPAGVYNIICPSGDGNVYFYKDYDSMKEDRFSYFQTYWMGSEQQMKRYSDTAEEEEQYRNMFTMEINNFHLEDGYCINNEAPSLIFVPAK